MSIAARQSTMPRNWKPIESIELTAKAQTRTTAYRLRTVHDSFEMRASCRRLRFGSEALSKDHSLKWVDLKRLVLGHLHHETETSWYLLLSIGDAILSYILFSQGTADGKTAFEANPIAAWFLNHYGLMKGLLGYKLCLVVFVCVIVQLVSLKRPTWGRLLLWLGIALTAWVDFYSLKLLLGAR